MENINIASFDFDDDKIIKKLDQLDKAIEDVNIRREQEKRALSELNKEYNSVSKEMDKLTKSGQEQSDEYDALTQKQNDLVKSIVNQRQKMSDLTSANRSYQNEAKTLNSLIEHQTDVQRVLNSQYDIESKNINELRSDRKILIQLRNEEVAVMGEQSAKAKQLNKIIADMTEQEKKLVSETEKRFYQIGDYAGQLQGNFDELKDAIMQIGSGNVIGGVNALRSSVSGLATSMMAFVATPVGAVITALAGVAVVAKYVWDYNSAIKENLILVNQWTKQTGESADNIRQQAQSIKESFGLEFEETIKNVKNLVQDFGLTYEQAFDLYNKGLVQGGLANKEFGDSISEYGVQFQQAGYSAEEFVNLLNTGLDLGIYTDKLPDAIKEAKLSLEEQTKATRDALVNAFGASFTDNILKRVRTGETSVKSALDEISKKAKESNLNQQQYAQLTADLFRGAGEDAGGAKVMFDAFNKSVEDGKQPLTDLEQKSLDLQQSFLELEKAKDDAFKSDSVIEFQKNLNIVWNQIKTGFIITLSEVVRIGVDGFTQMSAGVQTFDAYIRNLDKVTSNFSFDNMTESWNNFKKAFSGFDWGGTYEKFAGSSSARGQLISKLQKDARDAISGINETIVSETNKVLNKRTTSTTTSKTPTTPKKVKTATKKVDDTKKDLETALKLNQQYLQSLADLEFSYRQNELSNQIKLNSDKLKNAQILTEEMLDLERNRLAETKRLQDQQNEQEIARANEKARFENEKAISDIEKLKISEEQKKQLKINADNLLNEQLSLNQQAYQQKQLENMTTFDLTKTELENTFHENRKALEDQRNQFDFEQKILTLQNQNATESELQLFELNRMYQEDMSLLRDQLNNKLITLEQFATASANLTKRKANAELKIEEINQEQKMSVIADTLGGMADLLGENTELGKAFGIASALVNTWMGVTQVWKAESILPEPYATISKVGSTATVLASGLNAVKQIKKVDTSGKSNSSATTGTSASSGTTTNTYKSDYAGGSMNGLNGVSQISGYTQQKTFADANNTDAMMTAVKEGAKEGASQGTYSGSQQGLKDLSTDRQIQENAKY